ncbi:hypothetical protein DACRYDRAFT_115746 [Dacryopinax primogenitus]|uniref:NB-ARC domain-containing protein n=1 Tax=Dacryopinax primogenitus (strain DJM 731) TaxID=1858805 RepID=M5G3F8_DACPD|nr:uncharacterized protein DACRYDRAFT_115746 [Dacryopinax primogenitus]EJU02755.1 hypothetical protein DACRYDRAFT_115746 [Dacryopinax primogenitus]
MANLHKNLDSIIAQFALVHSVTLATRLDQMSLDVYVQFSPRAFFIDICASMLGLAGIRCERPSISLMVAHPTRSSPVTTIIADIPPNPVNFYGRDDLLHSITALLLQDQTCRVPILGSAGIGKTSLAAAIINDDRIKTKYGQSIWFVSCEGITSADGILQALIAFLGLTHESNARQIVLESLAARICALLVLDNLETAWDSPDRVSVELLLGKLAELLGLSLIITMRGNVQPAGVTWDATYGQPLTPLSIPAAHQMWIGITHRNEDVPDELLAALDGLPLAITLMAHQGQLSDSTELMEAYTAEKTAFLQRGTSGRLTSLDTSIQLSLNSHTMMQNPNALHLLSGLSLLPNGASYQLLPKIFPSMTQWRKTALALIAVALAYKDGGRLRILSPIREFMLLQHPPFGTCLAELRVYYFGVLAPFNGMEPDADPFQKATEQVSSEFANINSILSHYWSSMPGADQQDEFLAATKTLVVSSVHVSCTDCVPLLSSAIEQLEAREHHEEVLKCRMLLGRLLSGQNQLGEVIRLLEEVERQFGARGDNAEATECAYHLGNALRLRRDFKDATAKLREANKCKEAEGNTTSAALYMWCLGEVLAQQSDIEEALRILSTANAMYQELRCRKVGRQLRATWKKQGLFEQFGSKREAATCLFQTARLLQQQNRHGEACRAFMECRKMIASLGFYRNDSYCTKDPRDHLRYEERFAEALSWLDEAQATFERIGDRNRHTEAVAKLLEVLGSGIDALDLLAMANYFLGRSYDKLDETERAARAFTQGAEIYRRMGLQDDVGRCEEALAALSMQEAEAQNINGGWNEWMDRI